MPTKTFQVRVCQSCGLRYPLGEGHSFGKRCPACLGDTRLLLRRTLILENTLTRSESFTFSNPKNLTVLLDNIRSAWNVGSILRSADGFGFGHAYLCGITPTPDHEAVTKTSLGAEDSVSWSYHKDAVKLIQALKKGGSLVWALEEDLHAKSVELISRANSEQPVILILGNELTGVDPGLLKLSDEILYIPMLGEKKSFNVAIAFSIAAYQLRNK